MWLVESKVFLAFAMIAGVALCLLGPFRARKIEMPLPLKIRTGVRLFSIGLILIGLSGMGLLHPKTGTAFEMVFYLGLAGVVVSMVAFLIFLRIRTTHR